MPRHHEEYEKKINIDIPEMFRELEEIWERKKEYSCFPFL